MAVAIAGMSLATYAQTADEVLQKHIDAIGGKANWDKIKSLKMTGTMSQGGMDISMTQTTVNDKGMRMDISAMGQNGFMIITPTEGWQYMPFAGQTKPEAFPEEAVKMMKDQLNVKNTFLADKSLYTNLALDGQDTINSVACYKLKVTAKNGQNMVCYIDSKTYYVVRTEAKIKMGDSAEEQEMSNNYSDFKKQPSGIVLPMTFGSQQGDITFKTVEINKPVAENFFKPETK